MHVYTLWPFSLVLFVILYSLIGLTCHPPVPPSPIAIPSIIWPHHIPACLIFFSFCSLCSPSTLCGRSLIYLHCAYMGYGCEEKPSVCCSFIGMQPEWLLIHHSLRSTGPTPPSATRHDETTRFPPNVWMCMSAFWLSLNMYTNVI